MRVACLRPGAKLLLFGLLLTTAVRADDAVVVAAADADGLTAAVAGPLVTGTSSNLRATENPELAAAIPPHICGSRWLRQARAQGTVASMPTIATHGSVAARPAGATQGIPAGSAQSITVGSELNFPVFEVFGLVPATCRYAGEQVFIFVENRQWDTEGGSVFQSHVDALAELFEVATPADSAHGIYDQMVATFGAPPDVDGYEQIFLLIVDLPRPGLVGLFDANVADHAIPELRRDVIYLDEFYVRRQSYLARGTLAHEFQHLIHWNWDRDEEAWIDEGLSGYAEELIGLPEADPTAVTDFLARPDTPLAAWPFEVEARNYGVTYLFASFMAERFGPELIGRIVAEPRNGIFGIDAALAALGEDADYEAVWADWAVANVAGEQMGLGYAALGDRRVKTFAVQDLPLLGANGVVGGRWGTANVIFRTPGNVAIDFDGEDAGRYRVWSYSRTASQGHVVEVELNAQNQGRSLHTGVDSVVLIIGRTSLAGGEYDLSARRFVPTAVNEPAGVIAAVLSLGPGYPNPFNSSVQIPFVLARAGEVELQIIDILGRRVRTQRWPGLSAGRHTASWDGVDAAGRQVATGSYRVRLFFGGVTEVTPIVLLR